MIPTEDRIGILDRKLRIVNENAVDDAEWLKWTIRAFQSVYGFEYQGDNVLVARINLLMTFVDYYKERFKAVPEIQTLKKIANIIAWNIWQMDGLKGTVPLGKPQEEVQQLSWFGDISNSISDGETPLFEQTISADEGTECMIYDWRADRSIKYSELQNTEYITEKLKAKFEKTDLLSAFSMELFSQTVNTIEFHTDHTISLLMKNNQRVGEC